MGTRYGDGDRVSRAPLEVADGHSFLCTGCTAVWAS